MNKDTLKGKKILLIAPGYHDYISVIASTYKKLGAYIEHYESDPSTIFFKNFYLSRLRRFSIFSNFYEREILKTNSKILNSINEKKFDHIIIIKGRLLSDDFLKNIRGSIPEANFVLYQWDSI